MDIEFTGQLIDSMNEALGRFESAVKKKRREEANRLKVFIFDLHRQINDSLK
jgi:hypothetical protein